MANKKTERLSVEEIVQSIMQGQDIDDIKKQTLRFVVIPLIILFGLIVLFAFSTLLIEKIVTKTDPSTSLDFFKSIAASVAPIITVALGYVFGKNI